MLSWILLRITGKSQHSDIMNSTEQASTKEYGGLFALCLVHHKIDLGLHMHYGSVTSTQYLSHVMTK